MITQGDIGTVLRIHIDEKNVPVPLAGAAVDVVLKAGIRKFTKTATITGEGLAEVELVGEDLATAGTYYAQATVTYSENKRYTSDIQQFMVGNQL